jgi:hypothetical protein
VYGEKLGVASGAVVLQTQSYPVELALSSALGTGQRDPHVFYRRYGLLLNLKLGEGKLFDSRTISEDLQRSLVCDLRWDAIP